ncbi:uncharacterized protein LOC135461866 [Liolophura sinensis]|uniref:uncharacterized protein LOC135461866 n=1 Tax=Liolophura sinensis TaxID=3198878 RepID=UPI0031591379
MRDIGLQTLFLIGCVALVCLLAGTSAEIRLLCPRPQTPNSRNTQGPCDPQGLASGAREITDVYPGLLTVRWEETVYRKGAPSRIALKSRSQNTTCVLLDHIPHNDNQFTSKGSECNPDDYPIGRCRRSMTAITVVIPDIQCDDCYLQLISVDTSSLAPGDPPCSLSDPVESSNCSVYYSCADVKIWATQPGRSSSLQCEDYPNNLDGNWPYQLATTLRVNSQYANIFFNKASLELRGNTLIYDVQPKGVSPSDIVSGTEGLYDVSTALVAQTFDPVSAAVVVYRGNIELRQAFIRQRLVSGQLGIGLRTKSEGLIIFPLEANSTMFAPNSYSPLSAEYSTRGLLRAVDPAFSQADVLYSTPFKQAGPCAFATRTMTAALMAEDSQYPVGLVRATSLEYNLYVTAVIPQPIDAQADSFLALNFSRSATDTDPLRISQKLILPGMIKFVVDGVGDMADFLLGTLGDLPDTVRAVSSVNQFQPFTGTLRGGIWAEVLDEQAKLTGIAAVSLLNGTTLSTKLLVMNFTTPPQLGGLFGPSLPGRLGSQVFMPTSNLRLTNIANSSWVVQADLTINSAQIVRYLWSGLHYIDIRRNSQTPARSVSGQLSKLDRWACQNVDNAACLVSQLRAPVPVGDRALATTAFLAFFPLDSVRVELSIVIRNLDIGETVTRVEIRNDSTGDAIDITPPFTPSLVESGAIEGEVMGYFVLPGNDPEALKRASMRTVVYTSRFPNGEITGDMGVQKQPTRNASVTEGPEA